MSGTRISNLLGIALVVGLVVGSAQGKTIHVKVGGTGDGSSWANAYGSLQDALNDAEPNDSIWVGEGTYKPTSDYGLNIGDRGKHFRMKNYVGVYGGFSAVGDPNWEDRGEDYRTVLSGDIGVLDDPNDNCYHVFYHPADANLAPDAILDGFTITDGNADGAGDHDSGGGMFNGSSSPTVTNCTFSGNSGKWSGGMGNNHSDPTVILCTFSDNSADYGGGMSNFWSSPNVTDCIFICNSADWGLADWGGGMYNASSSPVVTDCIFSGNSAQYGGGMYNFLSSSPTITNCTFSGNSADNGGGMYNFWDNNPTVTNCILWGNTSASLGNEIYNDTSTPVISYCDIADCLPGGSWDTSLGSDGGGNLDINPCFADPSYWDPNGTPADANDDFFVPGDYHLKSQAGRYDPTTQSWIIDDVTSPCIDAGNPGCPLGDEPNDPNNLRINMGAYGGMAEASKTPTNWRSIADLTNDWVVDSNDLKVFVSYWLETGGCVPSDLNRSQNVDFFDYAIFANNWLQESKISCHVFSIWIETAWDYKSPIDSNDTEYIFDLEVLTDSRVERIEFITPSSPNSFEIPMIPEQLIEIAGGWIKTEWEYDLIEGICEWDYSAHFYSPNDLATYGDGEYTITVYYNDGRQDQTIVCFGEPNTNDPIPQPIQEPVFTSFSDGDILISPVTIIWQNCTDPAANLIWVGLETESTPEEDYDFLLEVDVNALDEPLPLIEGLWEAGLGYEVWYHAQNIDGIHAVVGKYSESSYEFRVVLLPESMVKIPAGEFLMGDHQGDGSSNERPVHAIFLDSVVMNKYEITNRQYCDYLNSAMLAGDIKVVEGRVYDFNDTGDYPYCGTRSLASFYSQIDYNDVSGTFSVRTKTSRDMSDDPMIEVSWYGAVAYCNWRSKREGYQVLYDSSNPNWPCDFTKKGYRLPTEAEWEYAARGGLAGWRFPWGDTISHSQANYRSYWSLGSPLYPYDVSPTEGHHPTWKDLYTPFTSPVGFFDGNMKYKDDYNWPGSATSYQTTSGANSYGLYDMAGNVGEWCNDWYNSTYYSSSPYDNPKGPVSGTFRVFRGGSWDSNAPYCRVAERIEGNPGFSSRYRGFRIVLDLN